MKKKEEKVLTYGSIGVAHNHACGGTGRANSLEKGRSWLGKVRHGRAIAGTGRARFLDILGSIFFVFLNHARTIT